MTNAIDTQSAAQTNFTGNITQLLPPDLGINVEMPTAKKLLNAINIRRLGELTAVRLWFYLELSEAAVHAILTQPLSLSPSF
jgi:hypothetical protein